MARTDLNLAWPYPGFHERFFSRVLLEDLNSAETGNRAWKVSGAQGSPVAERKVEHRKSCSVSSALFLVLISRCVVVPIKNKGVLATTATATATRTSKQQRFIKQNNKFARASRFLYISLPLLHNCDMKMPNFTFYGGRKQATTKFCF